MWPSSSSSSLPPPPPPPPPATTAATTKKLVLKSSDGVIFHVEENVLSTQSNLIRRMIEDNCANDVIPLPKVTANIFSKVVEYCMKHAEEKPEINSSNASSSSSSRPRPVSLEEWDAEFVDLEHNPVLDILLAAHYLEIKSLLDLSCEAVADIIEDCTLPEIRRLFNIKNDYTREEAAEVRKENEWAFRRRRRK